MKAKTGLFALSAMALFALTGCKASSDPEQSNAVSGNISANDAMTSVNTIDPINESAQNYSVPKE